MGQEAIREKKKQGFKFTPGTLDLVDAFGVEQRVGPGSNKRLAYHDATAARRRLPSKRRRGFESAFGYEDNNEGDGEEDVDGEVEEGLGGEGLGLL